MALNTRPTSTAVSRVAHYHHQCYSPPVSDSFLDIPHPHGFWASRDGPLVPFKPTWESLISGRDQARAINYLQAWGQFTQVPHSPPSPYLSSPRIAMLSPRKRALVLTSQSSPLFPTFDRAKYERLEAKLAKAKRMKRIVNNQPPEEKPMPALSEFSARMMQDLQTAVSTLWTLFMAYIMAMIDAVNEKLPWLLQLCHLIACLWRGMTVKRLVRCVVWGVRLALLVLALAYTDGSVGSAAKFLIHNALGFDLPSLDAMAQGGMGMRPCREAWVLVPELKVWAAEQ